MCCCIYAKEKYRNREIKNKVNKALADSALVHPVLISCLCHGPKVFATMHWSTQYHHHHCNNQAGCSLLSSFSSLWPSPSTAPRVGWAPMVPATWWALLVEKDISSMIFRRPLTNQCSSMPKSIAGSRVILKMIQNMIGWIIWWIMQLNNDHQVDYLIWLFDSVLMIIRWIIWFDFSWIIIVRWIPRRDWHFRGVWGGEGRKHFFPKHMLCGGW